MKIKRNHIIVSIILICIIVLSAFLIPDTLQNKIDNASNDKEIIEILKDAIGQEFNKNEVSEKIIKYCNLGFNILDKTKDENLLDNYMVFENALGILYYNRKDNQAALEHYTNALNYAIEYGDESFRLNVMQNIATIYTDYGNFEKALYHTKQAVDILGKDTLSPNYIKYLINLGNVYNAMNQKDSALYFYKIAERISEKIDDFGVNATAKNNIAVIYKDKGEYEKGLDLLEKIVNDPRVSSLRIHALILFNMAEMEFLRGGYENALKYNSMSESVARENKQTKSIYINYFLFSMIYDSLSQPLQGYKYYKKHHILKDSVYSEDMKRKIAGIETNYEIEKKKIELKEEQAKTRSQRLVFLVIILVVIILLIAGYILYEKNRRNEKNRRAIVEQELDKYMLKAISQQMNPHFIFNTLNSIQSYIYKNNKEASVDYLCRFSELIRGVLQNSQHHTIPIKHELRTIEAYLDLEKIRLNNEIDYSIKTDKDIDTERFIIPALIIQPYVENAVWHGLTYKEGEKKLLINP